MDFKRQLELLAYLSPFLGTILKTVKFISVKIAIDFEI